MKYKIENKPEGIDIEVDASKEKRNKLLGAFQECQEGRCSCPTQEYSKLESLVITEDKGKVHLHLKAKPGEEFDQSEINKCLEYTDRKIKGE